MFNNRIKIRKQTYNKIQPNEIKGMCFELASCFFFALFSVVGCLLSKKYTLSQMLLFKNFGGLLVSLIILIPKYKFSFIKSTSLSPYIMRSILGCTGTYIWFWCLSITNFAEATAINYCIPLFTAIFGVVILKEEVRPALWISMVIGFAGMFIILRPNFSNYCTGYLLAMATALLWSFSNIALKKATLKDTKQTVVFYLSLIMTILSFPFAIVNWVEVNVSDYELLFLLGGLSFVTHYTQSSAYTLAKVSSLQPINFFRLVFASVAGFFFLGQDVDYHVMIGGVIIFISGLFYYYLSGKKVM